MLSSFHGFLASPKMVGKTAKEISDTYGINLVKDECLSCPVDKNICPSCSKRTFGNGDRYSINESDDDKVRKFHSELVLD
jgi:hypothetical protein